LSESVLAEVNSLLMADIAVFNQRLS
jgi:hypothetical protein